jgi:N-terminal domain of anti-restriction factor ArdC
MASTEKTERARQLLEESVADLATSEGWTRYLESRSRFHDYSFGNVMLIGLQRPGATQVAGYKAWQSMGRQVRKGERGISILAPMVRKVDRDDETESDRVVTGFRVVSVFDVSQTDGEPIPEPPCRLLTGNGPHGLEAALMTHAGAEGLTVETGPMGGGANGEIDRDGRTILVGDHLGPAARCKTLAHELGHWHDLGSGMVTDRAAAEIVAEAVAFVVGQAAGLDTSDYSAGYVLTWARGNVDVLKAAAERIDKAAGPILTALEHTPEAVAA